ncbi:hypothetical protein MXB_277, partial [Myxobolus squamalis]
LHTKIRGIRNSENTIKCNRVIIRLKKLRDISENYQEYGSNIRKAQQNLVPWDLISQCCALCLKSFTIFTRRHHCRTCGYAICSACVRYTDFNGNGL